MNTPAPVKVYLYDLSNGLAKQLSMLFTGKQIDGIWHSSTVVYGKEYYFGHGVVVSTSGQTQHGIPIDIIDVGTTDIPEEIVTEIVDELSQIWTGEKYHLLNNNCNNFTNELTMMLTGNNIPSHIIGKSFVPIIDSFYGNSNAGQNQNNSSLASTNSNFQTQNADKSNDKICSKSKDCFQFNHIDCESSFSEFKEYLSAGNIALLFTSDKSCSLPIREKIELLFQKNNISSTIFYNLIEENGIKNHQDSQKSVKNNKLNTKIGLFYADSDDLLQKLNHTYKILSTPAIIFLYKDNQMSHIYNTENDESILSSFLALTYHVILDLFQSSIIENPSYCATSVKKLMDIGIDVKLHKNLAQSKNFEKILLSSEMEKENIGLWISYIKQQNLTIDPNSYTGLFNVSKASEIMDFIQQSKDIYFLLESEIGGLKCYAILALLDMISHIKVNLLDFNWDEFANIIQTIFDFVKIQVENVSTLDTYTLAAFLQLNTKLLSLCDTFMIPINNMGAPSMHISIDKKEHVKISSQEDIWFKQYSKALFFISFLQKFTFDICNISSNLIIQAFLHLNSSNEQSKIQDENQLSIFDLDSTQTKIFTQICSKSVFRVAKSIYTTKFILENILNKHEYQMLLNLSAKNKKLEQFGTFLPFVFDSKVCETVQIELVCGIIEELSRINNNMNSSHLTTSSTNTLQINSDSLEPETKNYFLAHLVISLGLLIQSDPETLVELANAFDIQDTLKQISTENKIFKRQELTNKLEIEDKISDITVSEFVADKKIDLKLSDLISGGIQDILSMLCKS
ncbi:hypothetical protein BB561_000810 [Smittium simulii]|uniref:PPPDE domain-containing protein n=1 Tax=Smittium simulii TaxID=133385 RepID=A0A2T9YXG4_9FUNG|nr:hypothetical protein BB561_000810 [Smittium simulii]